MIHSLSLSSKAVFSLMMIKSFFAFPNRSLRITSAKYLTSNELSFLIPCGTSFPFSSVSVNITFKTFSSVVAVSSSFMFPYLFCRRAISLLIISSVICTLYREVCKEGRPGNSNSGFKPISKEK